MSDLCMVGCEQKETAKDIITSTAEILSEMKLQLESIELALYGGNLPEKTDVGTPDTPPMLEMLIRQRDFADRLLKTVAHIREGLW